jgi:hypothetical protein
MCSSERSPIRLGGLSSNDCAAKEIDGDSYRNRAKLKASKFPFEIKSEEICGSSVGF